MYNFRTDLAVERREIYKKANKIQDEVPGIETEESKISDKIKVTRVKVATEEGAQAIGKPIGNYITIDVKKLRNIPDEEMEKISKTISEELTALVDKHVNKEDEVLVVGLGNLYSTPDSLGSKVVQNIEITRHIKKYLPQYIDENARGISAISPGVLGTTGMETQEILQGIVQNTKPKLIVVIDSLASKSIERISSTIQIADTGIIPGAGVDNARKELTENTLGVPVIAIGIPTVVETAVLVNDSLDLFISKLQKEAKSNDYLNKLKEQDNYEEIKQALIPQDYNLIVTPKEIDFLVEKLSDTIAKAINESLHQVVTNDME